MTKTRRVFSPEDRLSILQEAGREGFTQTCRKYNLSPSLLRGWRNKYLSKGVDGLSRPRAADPRIKELELENERLKKVITRQALEIEVKEELLKKTPILIKRK